MKALVYKKTKSLVLEEVNKPIAGKDESLIKVAAVGICGSDMHAFLGHDEIGKRMLFKIAKRMKLSNELRDYLMLLTKLHLRPIALAKKNISDKAIRRLMFESGNHIDDLMILCRADITTKNKNKVKIL